MTLCTRLLSRVYVEPVMMVYMICLYYLIPAQSSLYMYKVCRTLHNYSADLCTDLVNAKITANNTEEENVVSQGGSMYMFYQTIAFTIPSTIVTLLLGMYGDRNGRRLPLALPFLGQALGCSYYLLMASYEMLHVNYMLIGAFITGASGGFASAIMASFSHLSTTSSEEYRTVRIVVLQAVMGIGTAVGSFSVGSLVNIPDDPILGWERTFAVVIGLSVLSIIYIIIRFWNVPSPSQQNQYADTVANTTVLASLNIGKVLSTVFQGFPGVLQLTLVAIWFTWVTGLGEFDVLFYYTQRMGLDRSVYGYYAGYGAIAQSVIGALAVFIFKRRLNISDAVLAIIGLLSACLELLFIGISGFFPGDSVAFQFLWWSSPMAGMLKVTGPASLRSIAAQLVSSTDQSKLFAFISGSDGILQLLTSALYNYLLWKYTEEHTPSASFFVSLALALVAAVITIFIHRILSKRGTYEDRTYIVPAESDIN